MTIGIVALAWRATCTTLLLPATNTSTGKAANSAASAGKAASEPPAQRILQRDVAAVDEALLAQPIDHRAYQRVLRGGCADAEDADTRMTLGGGPHRQQARQRGRTHQEAAARGHSITSSARNSSCCGKLRPNARAVFRFKLR